MKQIHRSPDGCRPEEITAALLAWYDENRRFLPWREDPAPYHVWLSEIMLQQTRVEAAIPYYERFLAALPDVAALAQAPEAQLLKLWEGLGYYSRVRNLKKAAVQVMEEYGGRIPSAPEQLQKLCGVGPYTAAAIASIAFQVPVPSVDGNLLRVFARLTGYTEDIKTPAAKKSAEEYFARALPADRPGDMNQALMDLGAGICLPNGTPLCGDCPLQNMCRAHAAGCEAQLPKMPEKKERPKEARTILLIRTGEEILLRRRAEKGLLAGLFEPVNEAGHLSEQEAAACCEKMGLRVRRCRALPPARHIFTHLTWEMRGYEIFADRTGEDWDAANGFFVPVRQLAETYALPSAFAAYMKGITEESLSAERGR